MNLLVTIPAESRRMNVGKDVIRILPSEQYGSRGMKQAKDLIEGMSGLFAGGTLSEQDKDAVMKALQDIYWESKARNVEKYTPKKYKKTGTDAEE